MTPDTFTVNSAHLTPHEAVNLASRLLQFATQAEHAERRTA